MSAFVGPKNMPDLAKFLGVEKRAPASQTPEEIEAAGLRWHFALNRRLKTKGGSLGK